jgi:hypothetical protein
VNEAVGAGRADGLFVEAHRRDIAGADASHLGADQRGAVLEIFRAIRGPDLELLMVGCDGVEVLQPVAGGRGIAGGGPRQRVEKVKFRRFEL